MATAVNGNTVQTGDIVTILGYCTAISGTGSNATVTVEDRQGNVFTCKSSDCAAPQSSGAALSRYGKLFGVGVEVTVPATVVSVSGNTLTSTTASNTTVTHAAISTAAPKAH